MAYGFSVFWLPLSQAVGIATLIALTARNCEWMAPILELRPRPSDADGQAICRGAAERAHGNRAGARNGCRSPKDTRKVNNCALMRIPVETIMVNGHSQSEIQEVTSNRSS
jgi:hypothetical protein